MSYLSYFSISIEKITFYTDSKSWIVDFSTRFTCEKTPQNNFFCQNFSVENNYFFTSKHQKHGIKFFSNIELRKVFYKCVSSSSSQGHLIYSTELKAFKLGPLWTSFEKRPSCFMIMHYANYVLGFFKHFWRHADTQTRVKD